MAAILNTFESVKYYLTTTPETRGDDEILSGDVYGNLDEELGRLYRAFSERRKEIGAPTMETIRRSRQKLQAGNEDLRPSIDTLNRRRAKEVEYKDFFGGNSNE